MYGTGAVHTYTGGNSQSWEFPLGYCADGWSEAWPGNTAGSVQWLTRSTTRLGVVTCKGGAGRARGAYVAEAVLAAAHGGPVAADTPLRELPRELIRASGLVRRIGVNLNQAVAKLNATGQRSGDLLPYAAESLRRAERLDAVAEEVRKVLR